MSIFDLFKKKTKPEIEDEDEEDEGDEMAVAPSDSDGLICDTYDAICQKCEYGEAVEKLNSCEKVLYLTQIVEEEVNNGGFSQFFYNSCGDFAGEIVDAFTKIGALKTAKICQKAVAVFGNTVPVDRERRQALLENPKFEKVFEKCDDAFYEYEDDLEELNAAYIRNHREFFN